MIRRAAPAAPVERQPTSRLGAEFGKLWTASSASAVGDGVSLTAAPLMASTLTDDPRLIAGVTMALTLPYALFGIPAGVLVDRMDRRRSMAVIDYFRGAVLLGFTLLVLFDHGDLLALYLCFFLVGTGETYFRNAAQAIVPAVVPREHLERANGRLVGTQTAMNQFVGPLAGSAMFVALPALPFGVDALTFLVSAVLLTRLRTGATSTAPRPSGAGSTSRGILPDMLTGARWLLRHRLLRGLAAMAGLLNLVTAAVMAVLVVYAHRVLGLSDLGYGLLLACEAVGALLASWLGPLVVRWLDRDRALVFVGVTMTTASLCLWRGHWFWSTGLALALFAFATVTWDVVVVALRQTLVPDHLQGRVNSVYRLVAWGCLPIGAGLAGMVSHLVDTPTVFALGAACLATALVPLTRGARRRWISTALTANPEVTV